ncbi:MAG: LVIVD repeat-containing protein [Candidatus Hodarchaeota archaeon]
MRRKKYLIMQALVISLIFINSLNFSVSWANNQELEFTEIGYIIARGAYDVWIDGDLAYVTCGYSGIRIINISNPSDIDQIGSLTQSSEGYAHQIFVENNTAYIGNGRGGLWVVDLSDPEHPVTLCDYVGSGIYGWAVKVINDVAFVSSGFPGGFQPGFTILNVKNPSNPSFLGKYDSAAYVSDLEVIGNFVYIPTNYAGFTIVDVSNYTEPVIVGQYQAVADRNAIDTEIEIVGNLAYLITYQQDPQILDISNPTNISVVSSGYLDSNYTVSIKIDEDLAYVPAMNDGLFVFNVSNPTSPVQLTRYTKAQRRPYRVVIVDDLIYLIYQENGLGILSEKSAVTTGATEPTSSETTTSETTPGLEIFVGLMGFIVIIILKQWKSRKKKLK